jgi:FKBP-type peptidyl-prolyl cis-trans isomerase FkpA
MKYLFFILLFLVFTISCSKDSSESIEDYLVEHGLEAQKHDSGLYYIIENEGEGEHPKSSHTITMDYKGYYLDGEVFDSSYERGEPLEYPLYSLIRGWQIGVPLFKKGGKGKLIVPPNLGYGSNPTNGIRDDAILVFDIELIDFK